MNDSRPRHAYVLPDGTTAMIIFDHGELPPYFVSFTLKGGKVIDIPRADIAPVRS